MRAPRTLLALSLAAAALAVPVFAETTRTLRIEYAPTGPFAVENLAGAMRVKAGTSDKVVVVATVHAEDDATASLLKLEQVSGEKDVPTLRMIYPIDKYTTFRYTSEADENLNWLERLFGFDNSSTTKYAGRRVTVRGGSGVLLYADIEIELPRRAVEGTFRNLVGPVNGEGVSHYSDAEPILKDREVVGFRRGEAKTRITVGTGSGDFTIEPGS